MLYIEFRVAYTSRATSNERPRFRISPRCRYFIPKKETSLLDEPKKRDMSTTRLLIRRVCCRGDDDVTDITCAKMRVTHYVSAYRIEVTGRSKIPRKKGRFGVETNVNRIGHGQTRILSLIESFLGRRGWNFLSFDVCTFCRQFVYSIY